MRCQVKFNKSSNKYFIENGNYWTPRSAELKIITEKIKFNLSLDGEIDENLWLEAVAESSDNKAKTIKLLSFLASINVIKASASQKNEQNHKYHFCLQEEKEAKIHDLVVDYFFNNKSSLYNLDNKTLITDVPLKNTRNDEFYALQKDNKIYDIFHFSRKFDLESILENEKEKIIAELGQEHYDKKYGRKFFILKTVHSYKAVRKTQALKSTFKYKVQEVTYIS